ncbi:DNA integration/recombination/inversion protein [Enterococcus ureilyticus]|uniref:Epoxyqueuosine reductase QueH n=1 Tax=Enterococcus ureilyticus TaxID=1131292 RepID=A0A1E5HFQ4_9ENTE|nr:epoxyqueuosine reductase QueH [Enterococcus ureilyticus]MBM7689391.1 putative adenine nucleotide alpha hydrolase (AANH) superfamily ATPase [Enterococcus ureilyticus]OEG23753.1 DNA integration/recombination/inversion protein [Enterococcus ureilyticus]
MINLTEITEKMSPNQKINYDRVLQKVILEWEKSALRPTILLHSCCAPCSTYSLEYLTQYADVTIFFANSNIHPRAEYQRREIVQQTFVKDFNKQTGSKVKFLAAPYEPNKFIQMVQEKELTEEPEGGKRCSACFQMRLDIVAEKAQELGYDYFGSALTLSPKKNSQLINEIGIDIQKFYATNYLPSDFKKNNGYKRSIELCKEYDVYRQCYCGCMFAATRQGLDLKAVNKEAKDFLAQQEK